MGRIIFWTVMTIINIVTVIYHVSTDNAFFAAFSGAGLGMAFIVIPLLILEQMKNKGD